MCDYFAKEKKKVAKVTFFLYNNFEVKENENIINNEITFFSLDLVLNRSTLIAFTKHAIPIISMPKTINAVKAYHFSPKTEGCNASKKAAEYKPCQICI